MVRRRVVHDADVPGLGAGLAEPLGARPERPEVGEGRIAVERRRLARGERRERAIERGQRPLAHHEEHALDPHPLFVQAERLELAAPGVLRHGGCKCPLRPD
jgi:hypothetical protein